MLFFLLGLLAQWLPIWSNCPNLIVQYLAINLMGDLVDD